jgi:hypothetical protein
MHGVFLRVLGQTLTFSRLKPQGGHPGLSHLTASLVVLMVVGCASTQASGLIEAANLWRSDKKDLCMRSAKREYLHFLQANGVDEAAIRLTVEQITTRLDNEPVISGDATLLAHPTPEWLTKDRPDPNELTTRLQTDLLSHSSIRVMKALMVVKSAHLTQHAVLILHIIYDRIPMDDKDQLSEGLSQAHQTLAVKRFAMDTLESL